jgi:hypothetical protein
MSGTALSTNFAVSLNDWYDEDTPLYYQYAFYQQTGDYATEVLEGDFGTSLLRITLLDFTLDSQSTITLPQGVYNSSVPAYTVNFLKRINC